MAKGKRYSGEEKLNLKKVFAVIVAIAVFVMAIIMIKNLLSKAKNTKSVDIISYFALYQDDKWGILGSNGETVINPMYQEMPIIIDSTKDVFVCTYDVDEENGTYKTKAINSKNEEIFTDYENVEPIENHDDSSNIWYEENVLKVQKNGLWGLIDLNGKVLLNVEYDDIKALDGIENSIIIEKNGLYGLVNDKGTKICEANYKEIKSFGDEYKNGYIVVSQNGKYGIISCSGDQILEAKYEKIDDIYGEKYFVVEENGKQKLIDKDGNDAITSGFDQIKQIATSGIVYTKNNNYGLMDWNGNVLIDATYSYLNEINSNVFEVIVDGKNGAIDLQKNTVIPCSYKEVSYVKKADIYVAENEDYSSDIFDSNYEKKLTGIVSQINTDDGYLKIKIDDSYKYYNFKFEEKEVKDIFSQNKIYVSKKDGKYGFVDEKGNVVVDYIYDDATEANKYGYAGIKKDGLWGSINNEGEVIIEPYYNLDSNLKIDFIGKWHLGIDLNMNYYCER